MVSGKYVYMHELAAINRCKSEPSSQIQLEPNELLGQVCTPLCMLEWERALRQHLDRDYVSYLISRKVSGLGLSRGTWP